MTNRLHFLMADNFLNVLVVYCAQTYSAYLSLIVEHTIISRTSKWTPRSPRNRYSSLNTRVLIRSLENQSLFLISTNYLVNSFGWLLIIHLRQPSNWAKWIQWFTFPRFSDKSQHYFQTSRLLHTRVGEYARFANGLVEELRTKFEFNHVSHVSHRTTPIVTSSTWISDVMVWCEVIERVSCWCSNNSDGKWADLANRPIYVSFDGNKRATLAFVWVAPKVRTEFNNFKYENWKTS